MLIVIVGEGEGACLVSTFTLLCEGELGRNRMPYQVSPARWRQLLLLLAAAAVASPAAAFCGAARLARLARPHMASADALPPPASGAIPTRVALRAPLLPSGPP